MTLNKTLHIHAAQTYSLPTDLVLDGYGAQRAPLTTDAATIFAGLVPPDPSPFVGISVCLTGSQTNGPVFLPLTGD